MACVKNNNGLYQEPRVCNFAPLARRQPSPSPFTPAPPGVNDAVVADTSHTSAKFPHSPAPALPPTILYLLTLVSSENWRETLCSVLEMISPLTVWLHSCLCSLISDAGEIESILTCVVIALWAAIKQDGLLHTRVIELLSLKSELF